MYLRKKLICFILFLAFVLLVGCQQIHRPTRLTSCNQIYRPFYLNDKQNISTTDVYIFLNQQNTFEEIFQTVHYPMYGGIESTIIGPVGSLIANEITEAIDARNEKKNKKVVAINNALLGYDFDITLKNHLNDELQKAEWPNIREIELEHVFASFDSDYIDELSDEHLKESGSDAVMFVKTFYYFTKDFKSLLIVSNISMYPSFERIEENSSGEAQHNLANKEHCIYKRTMIFQETIRKKVSVNEALQYWSKNDGNIVINTLEKGSREIGKMLVLALNNRIDPTFEERQNYSSVSSHEGHIIAEYNDRILLRTADGKLYSLNKQ